MATRRTKAVEHVLDLSLNDEELQQSVEELLSIQKTSDMRTHRGVWIDKEVGVIRCLNVFGSGNSDVDHYS